MSAEPAQPKPHTITGDLRTHELKSRALGASRTLAVWLPPSYERDGSARFPVLYLHDGQNVFDTATAFDAEWQVDETATTLIKRGEIEPLIVVGVFNAGDARADDYTPAVDAKAGRGGGLEPHGRMLVEELKPWIDERYRTLPDSPHTALGGSSLGGLAALHLGLRYPTVFGSLAVLSPAVWWANRAVVNDIQALPAKPALRIWLDAGTAEGESVIPDVRSLRDALLQKGWRVGRDLAYLEVEGAGHDERAWAARVAPMLRFLFPGPRPFERTARALRRLRDRWRGSPT